MCNLKNNINGQANRNRLIDKENRLMVARGEGIGALGEKGEGIEKYRLVGAKQSQGCKAQRREYSR